jgi:DNA-binding MarR family transcriptional regulator
MQKNVSLSRELVELSVSIMRIVKQEFKTQAGANAITLTQFRMLHKIKGGACHVGKLAEILEISQPATSIMVSTMVKKRLLKRVPHPTDRRQIELRLTAKAHTKLELGYQNAYAHIDKKLSGFSSTQKKLLAKHFAEVTQRMSRGKTSASHAS